MPIEPPPEVSWTPTTGAPACRLAAAIRDQTFKRRESLNVQAVFGEEFWLNVDDGGPRAPRDVVPWMGLDLTLNW